MKDIASKLNCSVTTVSKAFKNHPDLNKQTRDLILKTAHEMGYVKNYSASMLRGKKTNIIGVLMASASNPFYNALFYGIESKARDFGYHIIYANSRRNREIENDSIKMFLGRRVDGLIIAPVDPNRNEKDRFSFQQAKGVIAFTREGGSYDMVFTNEFKGGYNAAKHLIEQGCRRILMLNSFYLHPGSSDRMKGYQKALTDYHIPFDNQLVVPCKKMDPDHRLNEGYLAVKEIIEEGLLFDGIFAFNDILAYGAYKALNEKGLHIPRDIAIVGFDDLDYSSILSPPLSSVSYGKNIMGSKIVELIIRRIEDDNKKHNHIELPTKLMIRGSSCRTKKAIL